jgi:two-component system sensor histidine kinase RegB
MAGGVGAAGESMSSVRVAELIALALAGVRDQPPVKVDFSPGVGDASVRLPTRAVSQALRSLLTNAQDASLPGGEVVVVANLRADVLVIDVIDRGRGIPTAVLARVGEPFFTTKPPGRGMGLGMFLARAVLESVGGAMLIDTGEGQGTRVTVTVPVDVEASARARRKRQPVATDGSGSAI